jgi:hypothetical protein
MDILNTTKRPLKIKLPGGKVLRLGPGNTGQINPKAAEDPAVKKLIEEGVIEIQGEGGSGGHQGGGGDGGPSMKQGPMGGGGGSRRSGDR